MPGPSEPGRDARLARLLFVAAAGIHLATMYGTTENPDAEVEYQTARALLADGSLAIGDTAAGRLIVERRFDVREGVDGRWYGWFGVGRAALGVPFVLAGRLAGALFPGLAATLASEPRSFAGAEIAGLPDEEPFEHLAFAACAPIAAAGCVALVFLLARALGAGRRAAFLASALYAFGTFHLALARSSMSDAIGLFFLLLALVAGIRARSIRGYALAGFAAAACVAVRPIAVLYVPPLAVYLLARRPGLRALAAAAVPAIVVGAILAWTNAARFGDPLEFGYGAAVKSGSFFSFPVWLGFAGLLVSPGRGLLFYAPLALLGIPGARSGLRGERRAESALLAATVACVLVPPALTETWHGAWCYGPRYALPAVALAVGLAAGRLEELRMRRLAFALAGVGLLASLPGVLAPYPVGIARADAAVAAEKPGEPENARFLYMLFQPRFAPAVHDWALVGEVPLRTHVAWARIAGAPGGAAAAAIPFVLLALGAAALARARALAAST